MNNLKYFIAILFVAALAGIIVLSACSFRRTTKATVEPVRIALKDGSRIENIKARHIFRELLLQELLARGNGMLEIYNDDSLAVRASNDGLADYYLIFDLMDYSICDIEHDEASILVSLKIQQSGSGVIEASFIDTETGKGIEKICRQTALKLADQAIDRLFKMRAYRIELPIAKPDSL